MANFVLADEINRAPAKVQSALLEVMAERHVTHRRPALSTCPQPFLVLATQNPIESEGVYPLPEAQRDRFLMKIAVDYPTAAEEREIVYRMGVEPPVANAGASAPTSCIRLQARAGRVFVHHAIVDYVVRLVARHPAPAPSTACPTSRSGSSYGASPRASLGLIAAGRALALLRGRDYVLPQDVLDVAVGRARAPAGAQLRRDRRRRAGRARRAPGPADRAAAAGRAAAARRRTGRRRVRAAAAAAARLRPGRAAQQQAERRWRRTLRVTAGDRSA